MNYWDDKGKDKEVNWHHIFPHSGTRAAHYRAMIDEAGLLIEMDLDGQWNKVRIPHAGRHPDRYHDYIRDALERLLESISVGTTAQEQLQRRDDAMQHLRYWVQNDPLMVRAAYWRC